MAHFIFKAKKNSGETYTAEHEAKDRFELYRLLRQSGDEVVSLEEKNGWRGLRLKMSFNFLNGKVKPIEKINFARNLGSMIAAGLPLSRALDVVLKQAHNRALRNVVAALISDINRGLSFTESLSRYPKVFPSILVSMVHAGEQSGTLADTLKLVANQMENSYNLEKRVRGALIYPCVIVCVMIIIAILMLIFVIPSLMKTFTELKVPLPATTQMLLKISQLFQDHGIIMFFVVAIIGGLFYAALKNKRSQPFIHAAMIKIPVIGVLVKEVNIARTARTLSSLLNSGVEVVEALEITTQVVQNLSFRNILIQAQHAIKKGELMSKTFGLPANEKLYSTFFAEMLSVGEETGKIGDMLMGVALFYEDNVDQKTKNMSTIIEPILMVVIGGAVGLFAISMISPMYSLVGAV